MTRALKPAEYRALNRRGHKFQAKSCIVDGIRFPSKLQAQRYGELKLLARAGKIRDLWLEVRIPIVVNGMKVCVYVADFRYEELLVSKRGEMPTYRVVVEDAKGVKTAVYQLKKRLMKAVHGITIREFV